MTNAYALPTTLTIQQRFQSFHAAHPLVYAKLCEYARKAKSRGYEKIGIQFLAEIIRWQEHIPGAKGGQEDFKLDNDFLSRYARLINEEEPDLAGFFRTRQLSTR